MSAYAPTLTAILDREPVPETGIATRVVDYDVDGTACSGFLARPDDDRPRPAVLVLHDWVGVSDYVRMRAEMLARLGYVAFAADLYGADVRPSQAEAPQVASRYYQDQALWRTRLVGGLDRLRAEPGLTDRVAAIGYCFGGAAALQLARTGADVAGVVSFHGGLTTGPPGEVQQIRAKVAILHGAADPVAPDHDVAALVSEFRQAPDLDWQLTAYAGAMHAFTLPDADAPDHGAQYQPAAERRSWSAMKDFLAEVLA